MNCLVNKDSKTAACSTRREAILVPCASEKLQHPYIQAEKPLLPLISSCQRQYIPEGGLAHTTGSHKGKCYRTLHLEPTFCHEITRANPIMSHMMGHVMLIQSSCFLALKSLGFALQNSEMTTGKLPYIFNDSYNRNLAVPAALLSGSYLTLIPCAVMSSVLFHIY